MLPLLDSNGNVVSNATSIIDSMIIEASDPAFDVKIRCTPSKLDEAIMESLSEISILDSNIDVNLSSYVPKIYGITSRKLANLNPDFNPYAECIIAFIDQWCMNGGALDGFRYSYEMVSTKRSWFVQRNILNEPNYSHNGLSWNLYGNGMSVLVYRETPDQLNELVAETNIVKTAINFEDGSAKKFLEDALVWFAKHKTRTGRNIKIYGAYPSIKDAIKMDKYSLMAKYKHDEDTIYWGGLFSTYSNFTQWEYHPGKMPNEIDKTREHFLNTSFVSDGNENIIDRISNSESIRLDEVSNDSLIKYLPSELEIIEEDFLSLYSLKTEINSSKRTAVHDLFAWAALNPASLSQTILKYRLMADIANSTLFFNIKRDVDASITSDIAGTYSIQGSNFFSLEQIGDDWFIKCSDLFGDTQSFNLTLEYRLPFDALPNQEDFDIIDLSDEPSTTNTSSANLMKDPALIGEDLTKTSSMYTQPMNEVNEFGPISGISIDPKKPLYTAAGLAEAAAQAKIYDEMITPPETSYGKLRYTGKVLDITSLAKNRIASANPIGDELITPDLIS